MKAVMLSIQPKWCELIASGKKTIEVRKTAPKLKTPFKCYIYETYNDKYVDVGTYWWGTNKSFDHACKKVIGEFVCDKIYPFYYGNMDYPIPAFDGDERMCEIGDGYYITSGELEKTCLTYEEFEKYVKGKTLYGLRISDLKIYDKPKELGEFRKPCPFPSEDCTDCPYMDWDYDAESDEEEPFCKKRITRPPQSWCYVEELSE